MDLGDHGSHYVAGSSRYLLSWPFSLIHAASQPSNRLWMVGRKETLCKLAPYTLAACDCSQLAATPSKEHATEVVKI